MAVVACKRRKKLLFQKISLFLSTSGLQPLAAEQTQADIVAEAKKLPLTTLAISENNFNFGDVKKRGSCRAYYTVTNTGDKPLVISTVKPGCGCTAPSIPKRSYSSGTKRKSDALSSIQVLSTDYKTNMLRYIPIRKSLR